MNYIREYADAIKRGDVTVGEWIIKIYDYLIKGLDSGAFFYDEKKADLCVDFVENFCHHSEGRDDLLKLELWQKAILASIFAIVDEEGVRQFREVFIVCGRKNGKTLLMSAVIAYVNYLDGEYGAKTFCVAPKLEQAMKVYDGYYQMLNKEPALLNRVKKRRTDIYMEATNSSVKPLPFTAKKSDGYNPHLTIFDELASFDANQGNKQYQVMKSALGSRKQPLIVSISTASYIDNGPYDELMLRSTSLLNGTSAEKRLLPFLYIIDDIAKWDTFEELKKSNPNLGVSVSEDYYREEIEQARNSLTARAEFLTKFCNIKQNSAQSWMPYEKIDACCGDEITLESLRDSYAVAGLDLSQTTDSTAACVVVEKGGILHVVTQFFLPANKIAELQEREGVPYDIFVKQGILTPSGENYVDYHDVYRWFVSLVEDYQILPLQIGYDRYSAAYLTQELRDGYGFHVDSVYQGENLTPVIKQADGLIRDGKLQLGSNQLLKSHFLNVALKQNQETRKCKPVKIDSTVHIDGFVAVLDALTVRMKWYNEIGEQLKNNT